MRLSSRFVAKAIVVLGLVGFASGVSAQSWIKQADMKVGRVEATTIEYRDDIYVFNGFKPGIRIADSIEKYDAATKQWSIIGSTTIVTGSAVTHNGVIRNGADVWIIGGRIGSHPGRVSDKVWIFNLNDHKWRRGPELPIAGAAGGAALVNNKIHWIGGLDTKARCDVSTHLVYDLGSPNAGWKNITSSAPMPTPRNHFSTAVVDGTIYLMGGQFGHDGCPGKNTQDTALVHAYNPSNNTWTKKANMPGVNSHSEPGTFVYKNEIYTTGGENAGSDRIWKYNPRTNKWSTFRTLPQSLVAPVARIVDGDLIVAGGGAPRAALATNAVYSLRVDNNPPAVQPVAEPVVQPTPPQPVPGSNTPEMATLISMEAEYFDIKTNTDTHQWVDVARANSSNDGALITTPDQGQLAGTVENTPMLSYLVNFNSAGKHYIWIRGAGDTNANGVGSSDSIHVGLNGTVASTAFRIDQFPAEWSWSRHTPTDPVASLNVVNPGINMINFWMREDGLAIDKFIITSDPNFIPTGFGPDVTDGTDGFVPPVSSIDDNSITEPLDDQPNVDADSVSNDGTQTSAIESEVLNDETQESELITGDTFGTIDTDSDIDTLNISGLASGDQSENELVESELIESDSTNNTDPEIVTDNILSDESVSNDTDIRTPSSSNGLFGGSLSGASLLILLMLSLIRVARFSRIS